MFAEPFGQASDPVTFPPFQEQEDVSAEDEVEDCFTDKEEDLGAVEEERSVILHLLSQLKLGMDLTRVGRVPFGPRAFATRCCQSVCVGLLTLHCGGLREGGSFKGTVRP